MRDRDFRATCRVFPDAAHRHIYISPRTMRRDLLCLIYCDKRVPLCPLSQASENFRAYLSGTLLLFLQQTKLLGYWVSDSTDVVHRTLTLNQTLALARLITHWTWLWLGSDEFYMEMATIDSTSANKVIIPRIWPVCLLLNCSRTIIFEWQDSSVLPLSEYTTSRLSQPDTALVKQSLLSVHQSNIPSITTANWPHHLCMHTYWIIEVHYLKALFLAIIYG